MIYFCAALLDDGRNLEAVNAALDEVAEGHLAGLDYSFGGYLDAQAAEGLIRLGRWSEAETTLARHMTYQTLPVGILRVARAGAMLAARRGDTDTATRLLADATARPTDGFHQTFLDHGIADVHLALGNWAEAAAAAERGWETHPRIATLWSARFAMLSVAAAVEQTLDALASGQPVDVDATVNQLQQRIDDVQADTTDGVGPGCGHRRPPCPRHRQPHPPDRPGPRRLVRSGAAMEGRRRRVVGRGRHAPRGRRRRLGRRHGPCRRSAPGRLPHGRRAGRSGVGCAGRGDLTSHPAQRRSTTRVAIDDSSIERLGLTAREAEVLALVATGQTNRQIGEQLFVSEKTASVHVSNILRKLGVTSRVDAAAVAQRLGVA